MKIEPFTFSIVRLPENIHLSTSAQHFHILFYTPLKEQAVVQKIPVHYFHFKYTRAWSQVYAHAISFL